MLNITNHQGNANQNHSEIGPQTRQNGYNQKTKNNKHWMWRKGNSPTVLVGI